MKKAAIAILLLCLAAFQKASTQAITRFEYFFDVDPGPGQASALSVTGNDSVTAQFIVNTNSLAPGTHRLGIRSLDAGGRWSHTEFRPFYIAPPLSNAQIVAAEMYIGSTDPGLGNAAPVDLSAADSVTLIKDSALNNLAQGDHIVNIRFRDINGRWSHQESRKLTVCNTYGAQSEMTYQIEGDKVFFTNNSLYYDTLSWRFGDGTFDTVLHPVKTYTAANIYHLQLITGNACGIDTLTTAIEIRGLQRINAKTAGNGGVATITFNGFGFTANTDVSIVKNSIAISPIKKYFQSSEKILATFNMNAIDTGLYHAVANLGSSFDTLHRALLVETASAPAVSLSVTGNRNSRSGGMRRFVNFQNTGNQDAVMVPFVSQVGFVPGNPLLNQQFFPVVDMVFLSNKGIFQNTYSYLTANGIATDVMSETDIDSLKKKKLIAYYKLSVPAKVLVTDQIRIINSTNITYSIGGLMQPPLFSPNLTVGDISSPFRDCMNAFLKRSVQRHMNVTINNSVWDNCFNTAFDTLAQTLRAMVSSLEIGHQGVPVKAIYSNLLAQMAQCGNSGLPVAIPANSFKKVVQDVTRNWLLFEDLDSIGAPCFDTLTSAVQMRRQQNEISGRTSGVSISSSITQRTADDDCPGAQFAPELAEICEDFNKPCEQLSNLGEADGILEKLGFDKVFEKFTAPFDKFCKVNTGSIFCEKLCELTSLDPNVKIGPGNNSDAKYLNHLQNAAYTIYFENLATASAPAAYVEVRDTLDKSVFDLRTFQTGVIGWGDSLQYVDANRLALSVLKDLRPARPNLLRIDVALDTMKGIAIWKFWTLNPVTLQLTENPFEGFLPPNTDGKTGIGFVSFNIRPKNGVSSGTVLKNKATIVFDENPALTTGVWEYRIDTTRPQSAVATLPPVTTTTSFRVQWGGTDAHAGINKFAVYVSANDSVYKLWKRFSAATSDTFHGRFGTHYKFFSVAVDRAGNFEEPPLNPLTSPDAGTSVQIALPVKLLSFDATKTAGGKEALLTWVTTTEQNASHFEVQRSTDGVQFNRIGNTTATNRPTGNNYAWHDQAPAAGRNYYRLKMVDRDSSFEISPQKLLNFERMPSVQVYPTITSGLVFVQIDKPITVNVLNSVGQVVARKWLTKSVVFDLSQLANGVYLFRIEEEKRSIKVIKE